MIIKPYIDINKIVNPNNIDILNLISNDIIKLNNSELNLGIWRIIDNYKENYPIFKKYYKEENSITQLFEILNNNDIFCFKYNSIEGCSICTPSINKTNYLNSIILYDINYLNLFNIE